MLADPQAATQPRLAAAAHRPGRHKHWLHLLEVFPDRYAEAQRNEQELRAELDDVAILRERRGGVCRPLTLAELRRRQPTHH